MEFSPHLLTVKIKDFGKGMPIHKKHGKLGLGLIAMRERAELLHGELAVTSVPNTWTTVSLTIPLTEESNR